MLSPELLAEAKVELEAALLRRKPEQSRRQAKASDARSLRALAFSCSRCRKDRKEVGKTGLCHSCFAVLNKHKRRKLGTLPPIVKRERALCRCGEPAVSRGRCAKCYARWRRDNPLKCRSCGDRMKKGYYKVCRRCYADDLPERKCTCGNKSQMANGDCRTCDRRKKTKPLCDCGNGRQVYALGLCTACYAKSREKTQRGRQKINKVQQRRRQKRKKLALGRP